MTKYAFLNFRLKFGKILPKKVVGQTPQAYNVSFDPGRAIASIWWWTLLNRVRQMMKGPEKEK